MSTGQWAVVLRHVRRLFEGGGVSGLSEGQLLERFAATRDEAAFTALIARHGPMVLGVCRGLLNDPNDVDDAFQATFLVLVRKAAALRDGDRLAQWLYGVARKVSLRARSDATRRKAREARAIGEPVDPHSTLDAELRELQVLIREEVDRLSTNDRMAVVLCYLEGLTHEEAADRLGWPIGTVKGRLSRARDKLRDRLTRRGVTLPAVPLAPALAGGASTVVPIALIRSTTLAAIQFAAGKNLAAGIVSAHAIRLMEGVLGTMLTTKLKIAAAALIAAGTVAVPGVLAYQGEGQGGTPAGPTVPGPSQETRAVKAEVKHEYTLVGTVLEQDELATISEQALAIVEKQVAGGEITSDVFFTWARRLVEAKAGHGSSEPARLAALRAYREQMAKFVEIAKQREGKGEVLHFQVLDAQYHLVEAERWLRNGRIGEAVPAPSTQLMGSISGSRRPGQSAGPGAMMGGPMGGAPLPKSMVTLNVTPADEKRNDAINLKLEDPLTMNFGSATPYLDFLKYVKDSTQDEAGGFPVGLPIYIDPDGLKDAEVTDKSTVMINLEGVPLRTTLHLVLRQLGLDYRVDGGLILITSGDQIAVQELKVNRANRLAAPVGKSGRQ